MGSNALRIRKDNCGAILVGDAMWTNETGLGLAILSADCVPIVLARGKFRIYRHLPRWLEGFGAGFARNFGG